jgi:hypothetical protein
VTDEVKFTDAQWDALAQAAETFAGALETERLRLNNVLMKNWAGNCDEGLGTIDNLRLLLQGTEPSSLGGAVSSEAEYLRALASHIRAAKSGLIIDDGKSSDFFRNAT